MNSHAELMRSGEVYTGHCVARCLTTFQDRSWMADMEQCTDESLITGCSGKKMALICVCRLPWCKCFPVQPITSYQCGITEDRELGWEAVAWPYMVFPSHGYSEWKQLQGIDNRDFPGFPVVRAPCIHCQGPVQFLVRKLRSHMPHSLAKKEKKHRL